MDDELPNASDQADYMVGVPACSSRQDEEVGRSGHHPSVGGPAQRSRLRRGQRAAGARLAIQGRDRPASRSDRSAVTYAERRGVDPELPEVQITPSASPWQGKNDEALQHFQRALALRLGMPDPALQAPPTRERMGRAADAERMYAEAIALQPNLASAHNSYGVFLEPRAGIRTRWRVSVVSRAQPDGPRGWANLGSAYQGLGDYTNARIAYEKSIAVDPTAAGCLEPGDVPFRDRPVRRGQQGVREGGGAGAVGLHRARQLYDVYR